MSDVQPRKATFLRCGQQRRQSRGATRDPIQFEQLVSIVQALLRALFHMQGGGERLLNARADEARSHKCTHRDFPPRSESMNSNVLVNASRLALRVSSADGPMKL